MGQVMGCAQQRGVTQSTLLPFDAQRSDSQLPIDAEPDALPDAAVKESSVMYAVYRRFPWLLVLMLVQSISSIVVEHFSALVERHVVLASFLTMLVGGGGNSSGQTVVETVRLLSQTDSRRRGPLMVRVLLRELAIGAILAVLLGACAYPRVHLLSKNAQHLDAVTISISYALIVAMANAVGVVVAMTLHLCDMAAVGAPPVVQVTVDVLGVIITMFIAQAILGAEDERERAEVLQPLDEVLR